MGNLLMFSSYVSSKIPLQSNNCSYNLKSSTVGNGHKEQEKAVKIHPSICNLQDAAICGEKTETQGGEKKSSTIATYL